MMMKNQRYRSCNHLTGLRFRLCGLPGRLPADYQNGSTARRRRQGGDLLDHRHQGGGAADPGFEALYPGIKVEYNDMNSTELYNRFISEQAAGGTSGDVVWSSSMDTILKLAGDYAQEYASPSRLSCRNGRYGKIRCMAPPMSRWCLSITNA